MNRDEYLQLRKTIEYHMDRYYNQDAPEITDYAYDQLMTDLRRAEAEHPEWITPDSPTQKVGGEARRSAGVKVTHRVPMLSIEDVFSKEEVSSWVDSVKKVHPDARFCVEYKIDGLSMTLRYQDGALALAETRGSGFEGEDVTANARVIPDVLHQLDIPWPYLEIRGEVYMTHSDFERFNLQQEMNERKQAANPRNLAAGTLRQLDPAITRQRGLRMLVFNIQDGPEELMHSHAEGMDYLAGIGVPVVRHYLCDNAQEVLRAIDLIGEERSTLPYDLDGAVVKIDQIDYRRDFPAGSKNSSGHIAYKYPPEERVVTMDEIIVDVGRTGKLTFTGRFHDTETGKPARLCGTSVSRATLHNQDYIRQMHIGVGGQYKVFKSGEIIPRLNGCVKEPPAVYQAPELCPVCHARLLQEENSVDIRCVNPSCPAQLGRTVAYFASLHCMNIMGLGETLIDELVRRGFLKDYADIYHLKEHRQVLIEEGILGKEKNTDKLLAAIEKSKENEPSRLLCALGIRNVGRSTARVLMQKYHSIRALMASSEEELVQIPDVGGVTASDICRFFRTESNLRVIERLEEAGVRMEEDERSEGGDQKLEGLTIVITGTLPSLGRKEAQELIEKHGGKCTGSVSKKTSMVLAGEAAGSKLDKARALGIRVISEEELFEMINES